MENFSSRTLGEIVTNDFRAAEIFKEAGLDFCCGGKKTLEQACQEKSLKVAALTTSLDGLKTMPANPAQNFKDWPASLLIEYIVNTHHKYVLKTLPELVLYTKKIADVHGNRHPELIEVSQLFNNINCELLKHLKEEEAVLFPTILKLLNNENDTTIDYIKALIEVMHSEHESAGGAMDRINQITGGYKVPADSCNTYMVTFKLLQQFEDDLHVHVHLENNILFQKALKL